MTVTMHQVRAFLDSEEPDYVRAAQLGVDALPHLQSLIEGSDIILASKAVSLAGMIESDQSSAVLEVAAQSLFSDVRVAAAASARYLPQRSSGRILTILSNDDDAGVRLIALKSIALLDAQEFLPRLELLSNTDPNETVREFARKILTRPP